jgi:tRNA uracil 4-sulfurtransferase
LTTVIVLRYAEIFLKGANRSFFERILLENVRRVLAGLPVKVHKQHARVLVEMDEADLPRAAERLAMVFGVQTLSPARVVPRDLDAISAEALRAARQVIERRGSKPTFKVETNRPDKSFPMSSTDVSRKVGGLVATETGMPVDVHKPQLEIGIEIGHAGTFVFAERLPGPGGLPVGSTGHVNLLLSGGIDSPVAGWLAMKRGCRLSATYFHSFPFTGDRTKEKVADLARLLVPWGGHLTLHVVAFTEVQKQLRDADPEGELAVVLYRRMMVRTAALIASRERALALVTGESLAQVASQTLENMGVIEEASPIPVLRPLLTYDKLETIALAQRIGTFETSIQPYDDCCSLFVPAHPATRSTLGQVRAVEEKVDITAMAQTLASTTERIELR